MFGLGMLAAHLAFKERPAQQVPRMVFACYALLPLLAVFGAAIHHKFGSNKLATDALMGLLVATILVLSTLSPAGWAARLLSIRPLVLLGEFSYSFYLVHNMLQEVFCEYVLRYLPVTKSQSFLLLATVGTVLIIAASYGFFYVFERPFLSQTADGRRRVALAGSLKEPV